MPTKPPQYWIVKPDIELTTAGPLTSDEAKSELLKLPPEALLFSSPPIAWRQTVDLGTPVLIRVRKPRADKGKLRPPKVST